MFTSVCCWFGTNFLSEHDFLFSIYFLVSSSRNDRCVLIAFLQNECSFRYKGTWKHQRQLCKFEYNHFKTKFQKISSCSVCRRFPIEIYVHSLSNHIQRFEKVICRWLPKFEYSVLAQSNFACSRIQLPTHMCTDFFFISLAKDIVWMQHSCCWCLFDKEAQNIGNLKSMFENWPNF